jgi:hypothetical protein
MDDKIQLLHDALKDTYELGTIEDFYKYLQDDNKRKMFYNDVIKPMYDVESLQEFESTYGLGVKKKVTSEPVGDTEGTTDFTTEQAQASPFSSDSQLSKENQPLYGGQLIFSGEDMPSKRGSFDNKTNENKELPWVKRAIDGSQLKINNSDGTVSTHKLSVSGIDDGKAIVYPTIIERDGNLVELTPKEAAKHAMDTRTAMVFDNEEDALAYSKNGLIDHSKSKTPITTTPDDQFGVYGIDNKTLAPLDASIQSEGPLEDKPTPDVYKDLGSQNLEAMELAAKTKQNRLVEAAEKAIIDDGVIAKEYDMTPEKYRLAILDTYAKKMLDGIDYSEYETQQKLSYLQEQKNNLPPGSSALEGMDSEIKSLEKKRSEYVNSRIAQVGAQIENIKATIDYTDKSDTKAKLEEIKKLQMSLKPVINPVAYAREKAETSDVKAMPGDTPMEKLTNYYHSIAREYSDIANKYSKVEQVLSSVPGYGDIVGSRQARDRFYELRQELMDLTPVITLNRKELKEDNFFSQLAKGTVGAMLSPNIVTTEQEQANKLYSSFEAAGVTSNLSKEADEAMQESLDPTLVEEIGGMIGFVAGMMPAFISGGAIVKGVGTVARGANLLNKVDKFSKMNKATRLLIGATTKGLEYEAAGAISTSSTIEEEASFLSGFMGETFTRGLSKLVPKKVYNATMLKLFGGSSNKVTDIFMKHSAKVASKTGFGFGELSQEYGEEIGQIMNESDGDLKKFIDLHSERFGDFDENVKFGLMTFGMGMAFGAATNSGKAFMTTHKKWLSEQTPEVQAEFTTIAADIKKDLDSVTQEVEQIALEEPSESQLQDDVKNGEVVTLTFENENDIPDVYKDKTKVKNSIRNIGTTQVGRRGNPKSTIRVTVEKSLVDYHESTKQVAEEAVAEEVVAEAAAEEAPVAEDAPEVGEAAPVAQETTTEEITIFRGVEPKKDVGGKPKTVHKIKKGKFGSDKIEGTDGNKGTKPIEKFTIPAGTTVETVKLPGNTPAATSRVELETEAIDNSTAQVVKLETIDAGGRETQYIIKDDSLIESGVDMTTEEEASARSKPTNAEKARQVRKDIALKEKEKKKLESLNKKFSALNKKYVKLDGIRKESSETEQENISDEMEVIQEKMGVLSATIEAIEYPTIAEVKVEPTAKNRLVSDEAYAKAEKELKAMMGNLSSGTGFKGAGSLAVVVARKLEDGAISVAEMTTEIVKMLGEEFRPYVKAAYDAATKTKPHTKRKSKTQKDIDDTVSKKRNKVTLDEMVALKSQIKVLNRGAKTAKKSIETATKNLAAEVKGLVKKGKINVSQMTNVMTKFGKVDMFNEEKISEFFDYMSKVFNDADYANKITNAKSIVARIKKQSKKGEATISKAGKEFAKINPSLVEDIDLFIEQATEVLEGLRSTTKGDLAKGETKGTFDIKKVNEYISSMIENQNKKIYDAKKTSFHNTTGIDPSELSLKEMETLLSKLTGKELTEEQKTKESKDKSEIIDKAAKNAFANFSESVLIGIKDGSIKVSKETRKMVDEFLKIDLALLTTEDKILVIDAIINFKSNPEATGGMGALLAEYKGNKGMFDLFKKNITTKIKSTIVGSIWASNISTLPMVMEAYFKSQSKALKVMFNIGIDGVINGSSKAEADSNKLMNSYAKKFKKKKMQKGIYFDDVNETERGVLAFIRRTVAGTTEEQKIEFERRKDLIEETYTELIKSTDAVKKKTGELIKESYDKLIVGSNNYTEVDKKADPVNLEGVEDVSKTWEELYGDLASVALDYYNINLGQDLNYTPDNYVLTGNEDANRPDIDQPIFNPDGRESSLRDEETGVLKENKRISKLPKGRVLSLGFDTQNYRNLKDAMTDINTAPSIKQIKGAMNSKYFDKVFVNESSRRIIKDRIYKYVELKRGKNFETEANRAILNRIRQATALGVRMVLGGVTQPLKQMVPMANTTVNAGIINTTVAAKLMLNQEVRDAVDNSGLPIANRGAASQADMESINLRIKNTTENIVNKGITKLDQLNRYIIDKTLVYTDVAVAKTSFVAYYIKAMKKEGIEVSDIDWKKPLNKEASSYAMQQVNRQQNVSDADLQGDLFTNKNVWVQVGRKTLFPFANFLLNQKTRMYSDLNTLYRNPTASKQDKKAALKSLGGLGVETIAFNSIGFAINQILTALYYAIKGEDESEEEKEKRIKNQFRGKVGNVSRDILSPIPLLDGVILGGVNYALEIIADPEDKDPFKVFSNDKKSFIQRAGVLGIAAQKSSNLYEMAKIAATGIVENEYMGKKSTKKASDENKEIMGKVSIIYLLYVTGALPFSEIGYTSEKALKEVQRAKKGKKSGNPFESSGKSSNPFETKGKSKNPFAK